MGDIAGSIPVTNQLFVLLMMMLVSMAVLRNYLLTAASSFGELSEKEGNYMNDLKVTAVVVVASIIEVMSTMLTGFVQGSVLP